MENGNSEFIDYVASYSKPLKTLKELYVPLDGDELEAINEQCAVVKSGKSKKKVATKDYLTKSIQECMVEEYQQLHFIPDKQEDQDAYDAAKKDADKMQKEYEDAAQSGDVKKAKSLKYQANAKIWYLHKVADIKGDISNEPKKVEEHVPMASKNYKDSFDPKKVAEFNAKQEAEKKSKDEADRKKDEEENLSRMKKYNGK